ncbi:MAG: hypothetical protein ACREML_11935 [Vulcanimicrobiaceae bacterium]
MDALVLKLTITPALIAIATLVGRRFGPIVSGWLVGLPLTSAPVIFFVALEHGNHFAAQVAIGVLLGTIAQSVCILGYAYVAARDSRYDWLRPLLVGVVAFAFAALGLRFVSLALVPAFVLALIVVSLTLFVMPRVHAVQVRAGDPSIWDLPARMIVATVLVIALTALSGAMGPRWTGLVSPFPIYGTILAVFAHRESGGTAAAEVMRGLEAGMYAFSVFFVILGFLIERAGVAAAFASATAATLVVQLVALWALKR